MKWIVIVAFAVIIGALVSAGVRMLRSSPDDDPASRGRMVRALALRVAVSVALFLFILLAWQLGWIQPTGLPVGQ
jgi:hypothetical protein